MSGRQQHEATRGPRRGLNTEVNVTSLVDVMMVLLVIFILVAPILSQGIDVKLPEAVVGSAEPEKGLRVTLSRTGRFLRRQADTSPASGRRVSLPRAKANPRDAGDRRRGRAAELRSVMDVLDRARLAGLTASRWRPSRARIGDEWRP